MVFYIAFNSENTVNQQGEKCWSSLCFCYQLFILVSAVTLRLEKKWNSV